MFIYYYYLFKNRPIIYFSLLFQTVFEMQNFVNPTMSILADKLYITEGPHVLAVNKLNGTAEHLMNLVDESIIGSSIYHPVMFEKFYAYCKNKLYTFIT